MVEPSTLPDVLTVEEAARVLRVGRTAAYELARVWRESGGARGLPNISLGGSLRVPTARLEAMLGRPISGIPARSQHESRPAEVAEVRPIRAARSRQPRKGAGTDDGQTALPLS